MTLGEWIKNKIIKFLGLEKLTENPNEEKFMYISDAEGIRAELLQAYKVWYLGNSDDLLAFYTAKQSSGFLNNPTYNRNKRNYFWSLSAQECKIKRVHSGVPHAIVQTASNIVGSPNITLEQQDIWDAIATENDFDNKLTQQARPLTFAEGWGGWKINFNKNLSKHPIWEYYDGLDVEYIYKSGLLVGMLFKSYYRKKDKQYVLLESRYRAKGNSYITYELFQLDKNNSIKPVALETLPELAGLEAQTIEGLDEILAVPSRYFFDSTNLKYGKSVFAGKLDLLDFLDEVWSQASQTNRVSTPITFVNPDVMQRGPGGAVGYSNYYNRQFIMKEGIPDGEGRMNQDVITDQPDLNFDKYGDLATDIMNYIFIGVLSTASLGIDISKKDNADAQREKEKVSIYFRDSVVKTETVMVSKIVKLSLMIQEFMDRGVISLRDYDINVKYSGFANPSTETLLPVLGNAWSQGQISTERFVNLMWPDDTPEDKEKEIAWLDENRKNTDFDLERLLNDNENSIRNVMETASEDEGEPTNAEGQLPSDNLS